MRCLLTLPLILALLFTTFLTAQEAPTGKTLLDRWYVRKTPAGQIGYLHLVTREVERGGQKLRHSVQTDTIKYLRSGDPYSEENRQESWETADGKVVELLYRTPLGKNQFLVIRGTPKGNEIRFDVLDDKTRAVTFTVTKPWNPAAIGLFAQENFLAGKELKPGQTFGYAYFQTSMNAAIGCTLTVVGPKKVALADGERELVEVKQTFPKEIYFDPSILYVDPATGLVVRTEEESTSFGKLWQEIGAKEVAARQFEASVKDKDSPITISAPIKPFKLGGPKELRVKVKHDVDDDLATVFVPDARQQVVKASGKEVDLKLLSPRTLEYPAEPAPAPEYLASNFYIRSDAPEVTKLAKEIVGEEKDPRRRMKLLRTWVRKNVKGHYEVPFATADEVARTLEGDCTEMGCLEAALARALGIPSRVAFGLVYDPNDPGFGGHLWTEVYLDGHWEPWDATGVLQMLGAAYLKVGAYSLADVLNPDELTAVRRAFAGKMHVELQEAK